MPTRFAVGVLIYNLFTMSLLWLAALSNRIFFARFCASPFHFFFLRHTLQWRHCLAPVIKHKNKLISEPHTHNPDNLN